ncbi:MAG: chromate transporter [Psychrobacter glaciei]|jgi:chromate transporter
MSKAILLFLQFLALGFTSFGGPAAHLGYFRTVFVEQKKWLTESEYSQLIALSQFLPGPGSSQVGFAIGLKRMGLLGGILAFIGFTLPSFIAMVALASGLIHLSGNAYLDSFIHIFKLLAVIVVLDAVLTMSKSFCSTNTTKIIAVLTACIIWLSPLPFIQVACLAGAGMFGLWKLRSTDFDDSNKQPVIKTSLKPNLSTLIFIALFVVCIFNILPFGQLFSQTFVAGSLVFGGGHVVLPLLQESFAQSVGQSEFITGYAAAQAIPGPMFAFASYLGALSHETAILGGLIATAGIFLPGFLLILAFQKNWSELSKRPNVSGVINGVNASVVGLLAATLYTPIYVTSVMAPTDMAIVSVGFLLLRFVKLSILKLILVACLIAIAGPLLAMI